MINVHSPTKHSQWHLVKQLLSRILLPLNETPPKDRVLILILIATCITYNYHPVFYGGGVSAISIYNLAAYAANELMFPFKNSLSINPIYRELEVCVSNATFLPPGEFILVKLISTFFGRNHTTFNIFLLFIQILNTTLIYTTLRKVAGKLVSFALTIFMIYTYDVCFVNDSLLQPLIILVVLMLVCNKEENSLKIFALCAVATGCSWIFRQNVGLFLTAVVIGWIFLSHIDNIEQPPIFGRKLLILFLSTVLICGLIVIKILKNWDDKIWYLLPYYIFWGSLFFEAMRNKNLYINHKNMLRELILFLSIEFTIFGIWMLYFGSTIGLKKYFYTIFIQPFMHIKLFEYSFLFYLKLGLNQATNSVTDLNSEFILVALLRRFYAMFRWSGYFSLPFLINLFASAYFAYQLIVRRMINVTGLKITSISIVGIFMCYPIESYWILTSKLIIFLIIFAYLLQNLFGKKEKIIVAISCCIILFAIPPILQRSFNTITGKYSSYQIVNDREDLRLSPDIAEELKILIALIRDVTHNQKYYIIDGFTDMYSLYNLAYYEHKNYYSHFSEDYLTPEATKDLLSILRKYPFILINQKDYDFFMDRDEKYMKGLIGRRPPLVIMEYVVKNYAIVNKYNKPANIGDIFLPNIYILKQQSQVK